VLSAVFIPTAFIPGITGRLYQQFALTIAISVILSAFNALTLSPALSAILLRPREKSRGLLRRFFDGFNRVFARTRDGYVRVAGALLRKSVIAFALLVACALLAVFFGGRLPSGFLPDEDQGFMYLNLQLPSASSLQRTEAAARELEQLLTRTPGVESSTSVIGFSLLSLTRSTYNAFFFVTLKEWKDRKKRDEQYQFIRNSLNRQLAGLPQGVAFAFSPPAIPGLGTSGGFTLILEDRSGGTVEFLATNVDKFLAAARKQPELATVNTTFLPRVPQQFIAVDRDKVLKQGIDIRDVYRTIQTFMGGSLVNFFNRFGRQWQVYVEAEGLYRPVRRTSASSTSATATARWCRSPR
jgi:HAE1 family hydrophobic/amphiphilic exporter-1